MRLLHTSSLEFTDFIGENLPIYAILSHTWEQEEVTFQDMQSDQASRRKGYAKLEGACSTAKAAGFEYIWIDTCCIDKTNNAELSEAINSMYRWYEKSAECYAYLADVSPDDDLRSENSSFSRSKWFTRGWTLQELIAPLRVVFFASNWQNIGNKEVLRKTISAITSIPIDILRGADIGSASIAQRMSWASHRQTTRMEDIAYCLLGIFRIHMPLIYGERKNAFVRLQEEILKTSNDHSIFAWKAELEQWGNSSPMLLAPSPAGFRDSGSFIPAIVYLSPAHAKVFRTPITLDKKGSHMCLSLKKGPNENEYIAVLKCLSGDRQWVAIRIKKTLRYRGLQEELYARSAFNELIFLDDAAVKGLVSRNVIFPSKNLSEDDVYFKTYGTLEGLLWRFSMLFKRT